MNRLWYTVLILTLFLFFLICSQSYYLQSTFLFLIGPLRSNLDGCTGQKKALTFPIGPPCSCYSRDPLHTVKSQAEALSHIFPALSADIFSFPAPIPKLFEYSAVLHSPGPWEFCTKISISLLPVDWYRPILTPQGLFLAIQCATAPDLMLTSFPRRQKATLFLRFMVLDPLATLLFILPTWLVSLKGNGWVRERQNAIFLCLHSLHNAQQWIVFLWSPGLLSLFAVPFTSLLLSSKGFHWEM